MIHRVITLRSPFYCLISAHKQIASPDVRIVKAALDLKKIAGVHSAKIGSCDE